MTIVRDPDTSFPSGTEWNNVWVQNKSKLKVTITGAPSYSTDTTFISYHEGTVDGVTYYGANMITSGDYQKYFISQLLSNAGTITVSSKVIDKRGVSSDTVSQTLTVYSYSSPSITGSCTRCDANNNPKDDGQYLYYNISGVISSINNKNAKTIRVKWKEKSSSSYPSGNVATLSTSSTPYSYSLSGRLTSTTFATDKSYDILFEVEDSFETTPMQRSLNTGFDLMNFNVSGKSMAIGKMSEAGTDDTKLEIAMATYFSSQPYINGQTLTAYLKSAILQTIYPVGAIYATTKNENPATTLGFGTWTRVKDKMLLGYGDTYTTIKATGGNRALQAHTHGIPALTGSTTSNGDHGHRITDSTTSYGTGSQSGWRCLSWSGTSHDWWQDVYTPSNGGGHSHTISTTASTTDSTGSGAAADSVEGNMPPYYVVYIWERTA